MDYRALLLKYMVCCIESDGTTHLPLWDPDSNSVEFSKSGITQDEYAELERLATEARAFLVKESA